MVELDKPIAQVLEAYRKAVHAQDAAALIRLYDAKARVFDAWGIWSYEGADAWQRAVEGWLGSLGSERVVVAFDDVKTTGDGDFTLFSAIVRYSSMSAQGRDRAHDAEPPDLGAAVEGPCAAHRPRAHLGADRLRRHEGDPAKARRRARWMTRGLSRVAETAGPERRLPPTRGACPHRHSPHLFRRGQHGMSRAPSNHWSSPMSLFSAILDKLGLGHKAATADAPSTAGAAAAPGAAPGAAAGAAATAAPAAMSDVDVAQKLDAMAAASAQTLNWKTSIVDMLKLLGLDSSFEARKALAQELACPGRQDGRFGADEHVAAQDGAAEAGGQRRQRAERLAVNAGRVRFATSACQRARPMPLEFCAAAADDFPALQQLLEFYQYDLSTLWLQDLDAQGRYGYDLSRPPAGAAFRMPTWPSTACNAWASRWWHRPSSRAPKAAGWSSSSS